MERNEKEYTVQECPNWAPARRAAVFFSWVPGFWWWLGWLKKLPHRELGKPWDKMILRSLSALTFCQVLSPLPNFSLAGCQAAWGTRGFQGGSRAESAFWKLSSRHGTLSLHLYREMALLVWRLLTLQPILLLHFLGIAPSSLHAGPPQLTALSAVLIGTPSPHPCVSAHLQMTRGLIRRKCFTLSSPRKSFMTQNYKPLREILSFRSLFSQFSVLAFWGFHPLIPPSIEFRYQSVCYHY